MISDGREWRLMGMRVLQVGGRSGSAVGAEVCVCEGESSDSGVREGGRGKYGVG